MNFEILGIYKNIVRVQSDVPVITDAQSALDLIATVKHETNLNRIIIDKSAVTEEFFILSTRIAGDILQKFVNYRIKLAVVGDFSQYTSRPLTDFIYESNNGRHFFFVGTVDEAIEMLG